MNGTAAREGRVLRAPIVSGAVLALLALIAASLTASQAILLDGFFSVVYIVSGLFTLHVSRLLRRGGSHRFPFGYASFEPLTNLIKSLLMAGVSVFAVWNAVSHILTGGTSIALGGALAYACVAVLITGAMALYVWRESRHLPSPLIQGDLAARTVDALTAIGVLVAFLAAWWLHQGGHVTAARYADPVLTLVMVALTLGIPYSLGKEALSELLSMAPHPSETADLEHGIRKVLKNAPLEDLWIRTLRIGRVWEITVHAQLEAQASFDIRRADAYKQDMDEALSGVAVGSVNSVLIFSYQPVEFMRESGGASRPDGQRPQSP